VGHSTRAFVGIDVAKVRNAIAVADGERGGEVRYIGEVDASDDSMRRAVSRSRLSMMTCCFVTKQVRQAMASIA
jgi:hypothetical protein